MKKARRPVVQCVRWFPIYLSLVVRQSQVPVSHGLPRSLFRAAPLIGSCTNLHIHSKHVHCFFSVDLQKSPQVLSLLQQQAHFYTQTFLNCTTINEARNETSLCIWRCCCTRDGRKTTSRKLGQCWTAIYCLGAVFS